MVNIETRGQPSGRGERCELRFVIEQTASADIGDIVKDAVHRTGFADYPLTKSNNRYIIDTADDRVRLSKIQNLWLEIRMNYRQKMGYIGMSKVIDDLRFFIESTGGETSRGGEVVVELVTAERRRASQIKREIIKSINKRRETRRGERGLDLEIEAVEKVKSFEGVDIEKDRRFIISTERDVIEFGVLTLILGDLDEHLGDKSTLDDVVEDIAEKGVTYESEGANILTGESHISCRVI